MKKVLALFVVCVLLLAAGAAFAADKIVVRVNHTLAPDSHYHIGLENFGKMLSEATNGRIELQIFHSSQLGSERDAIEGVSMGTLEMTLVSSAPLANFTNSFLVFDLPFIVQDRHKLYAWLDGPQGTKMLDALSSKNIKGLGIWENGFRMLTNSNKPVLVPSDMKGLKIRLMENPIHLATFRTLGAYPVPIPFGELFTALQQKTVDGQENPLVIISTSKFAEVQKYLSLTGHFYAPAVLILSKDFWDNTLDDELRKIFIETEQKAREWQRNFCIEIEAKLVDSLKEEGMEISVPDKAVWFEAAKPVYQEFEEKIGKELIEDLINSQK